MKGGGLADKEETIYCCAMIGVLKQAQVEIPVAEVVRTVGISEQNLKHELRHESTTGRAVSICEISSMFCAREAVTIEVSQSLKDDDAVRTLDTLTLKC
jgi:molybdopterin-biosynthesis enzyme MoeA-like protein